MSNIITNLQNWFAIPRKGMELYFYLFVSLAICLVVLYLIMCIPPRFRKAIIISLTFIGGLYFSIEYLIPRENALTRGMPTLSDILMIISCFALFLGIGNLFRIHGRSVIRKTEGWYNGAAFFIAFFSIIIIGLLKDWRMNTLAKLEPGSAKYIAVEQAGKINADIYSILFNGFLASLDATMFSLIAFYIVSAAYRAFRIRSPEAVLMMVAATIIMLALVPVGARITNWLPETGLLSIFRIENIGYWIITLPNMAVQRAIGFGIAVGSLASGLRIWLSLERGSFFDRQL